MATKSNIQDGVVYSDVPFGGDDDDDKEPFRDEEDVVQVVVAEEMEAGNRKPVAKKRREPMEVHAAPSGGWSVQESNDFWTCCVAQGLLGLLGSGFVYCSQSHRPEYPTRHAWNGCCTGFLVVFILYILLVGLGSASGNHY